MHSAALPSIHMYRLLDTPTDLLHLEQHLLIHSDLLPQSVIHSDCVLVEGNSQTCRTIVHEKACYLFNMYDS